MKKAAIFGMVFIAFSFCFTGCDGIESANKAIEQKGIPYNASSFADSIHSNNVEITDLFIKAGFDVNQPQIMVSALDSNNPGLIKKLLNAGFNPNLEIQIFGNVTATPLVFAIVNNKNEVALELINSNNIDLNKQSGNERKTALMWACEKSNTKIVSALLSKGVNTSLLDAVGMDALVYTIATKNDSKASEIIKIMKDKINPKIKYDLRKLVTDNEYFSELTPLHLSCSFDMFETSRVLTEMGVDVNAKAKDGATPLIMLWKGIGNGSQNPIDDTRAQLTEYLLAKGADKKATIGDRLSAYTFAVNNGAPQQVLQKLNFDGVYRGE